MESVYSSSDLLRVYKAILNATSEISYYLRYNTRTLIPLLLAQKIESENAFGDE